MKSLCRTCGETFGGVDGFDRHRVGEFNNQPPHYGRRCLTPAEMEAKGWVKTAKGLWTNSKLALARGPGDRHAEQDENPTYDGGNDLNRLERPRRSYASQVDDPVLADRRHIARRYRR